MEYNKKFSRRDGDNERPRREGSDRRDGNKPYKKYNSEGSAHAHRSPKGNDEYRSHRSFSDNENRSHRSYSDNENRPRRSYSDNENRPRRSYSDNDDKSYRSNDRSYAGKKDDRSHRQYNGENSDRPRRQYGNDQEGSSRRQYGSRNDEHRSSRTYDHNHEDRPRRQNDRQYGEKRSQRKYRPMNDEEFDNIETYEGRNPRPAKGNYRKSGENAPKAENKGTTRLNKYIANAGICSRRDADKLIAAGSVTVNGKVVSEMGYKVLPGDVVAYDGETLKSERKRYFLLNKPKGYITTADDPQERKTVMMLIDGACPERIYPVGRLDRNTTGLLLFTNDGELAKKLTHPSTGVYKIYHVELDKPVTREDMKRMFTGIELEDGPIQVDDVQYAGMGDDKRIVGVELHSGRNRIVRRIFESLGYDVHKLDRVVFAGLTKKDLPRGRYRELTEKEISFLKMI